VWGVVVVVVGGGVEESLFQEESVFWGIVAVDQVLENGISSEFA
jgi:hypothetical protein